MKHTLNIDPRFSGPPNFGHGGYVSGLLDDLVPFTPTITLRNPIPLSKPLDFVQQEEAFYLMNGEQLIAEVKAGDLAMDIPKSPTFEQAQEATKHYAGFKEHLVPNCFGCGTNRAEGDGLRIFPGRLSDSNLVATPWTPAKAFGNAEGIVEKGFIWAALDCPGAFAILGKPPLVILGRVTGQIFQDIKVNQNYIVAAWPIGHEGRKFYSGTAIYAADGTVCAATYQIWIEVKGM